MPIPDQNISPIEISSTPLTGTTLIASDSSNASTLRSQLLSNTGGRARQSWRTSISTGVNGMLRRSNTTVNTSQARLGSISGPIRRLSADTTNSSPTDPALIPATNSARLGPISGRIRCVSADTTNSNPTDSDLIPAIIPSLAPVELPASPVKPVTKPDEQRSFLDLDSDSDDSSDDDHAPIISRANSVRVQRPQLVQNHSGNNTSVAASEMTIKVYGDTSTLPILLPVVTKETAPAIHRLSTPDEDSEYVNTAEVSHFSPSTPTTVESSTCLVPEHAYRELTASAPSHFSFATTVDSVSGGPAAALANLTANAADNASIIGLAPTPASQQESFNESIFEIPDTPTEVSTLPSPMGGFGSIRVPKTQDNSVVMPIVRSTVDGLRINPVDTEAAHLQRAMSMPNRNQNRKVTIRPSDLVISDSHGNHRLFRDQVVSTPYPTRNGSMASHEESIANAIAARKTVQDSPPIGVEKSDRFPSPLRPEVLVLELAAAGHAALKQTIAIEINDKGSFDDEMLFKTIKKSYKVNVLGAARRIFSARTLNHATFSNDTSFESQDFVRHMASPRVGRRRKGWLIWLRSHQPIVSASSDRYRESWSTFAYYSLSSTISAVPRMPFQRSLPSPPKVLLHFEFSFIRIVMAASMTLTLSCLTTMLWVFIGLPGHDMGPRSMTSGQEAERRVLTGLVLGVLVLLLGSMGSATWIGASWILL